jgi:hypothetical protein
LPEASFARIRHHIVFAGKVLVLNWDAVMFWFTIKDEKLSWSLI